jgi:glycosyltransferase involved in cell wall biosynthesis
MEGMALGRPLVATRTGGTPELVVDGVTGLLIAPGNAAELAQRVIELVGDPERARRMGVNGRRLMETRFSEDRHITEIARLYQECRATRASGRVAGPGLRAELSRLG